MTGSTTELTVDHPHGLHLRPAARFVKLAASLGLPIAVTNLTRDPERHASARSLLQITGLGIDQGHRIRIEATGEGAEQAVDALRALVESGFAEG
ncbi:MAG: HPr family phosphocarrier protein [Candidatus Dormibacteraceae bacterium]